MKLIEKVLCDHVFGLREGKVDCLAVSGSFISNMPLIPNLHQPSFHDCKI